MRTLWIIVLIGSGLVSCPDVAAGADSGESGFRYPLPEAVTFLGVEQLATKARNHVFAVQIRQRLLTDSGELTNVWKTVGSGIFTARADRVLFGVTCKHVLSGVKQNSLGIESSNPICFVGVEGPNREYERVPVYVVHLSVTDDLAAVFPVVPETGIPAFGQGTNSPTTKTLVRTAFASDEQIRLGRGLVSIGYPLGQGSYENENSPILRIGIVAQVVRGGKFLIDGGVSPGNSGSPIYTAQGGKVVGIATGHLNESINLRDPNGKVVASLPYNAGLAIAVSATQIGKFLEEVDLLNLPPPPTEQRYIQSRPLPAKDGADGE